MHWRSASKHRSPTTLASGRLLASRRRMPSDPSPYPTRSGGQRKVHAPLTRAPSEFRRAVWVFAALLVVIFLTGPSYLLSVPWWLAQSAHEVGTLAISVLLGIAAGMLLGRDIWNLVARNNPLWFDLLIGAAVLAVVGGLVYLR